MTTLKDLAEGLRICAADSHNGFIVATKEEAEQIAGMLDRLAAIDSAVPAEVESIRREHLIVDAFYGEQGLSGGDANECHRQRATLLAIVAKQAVEIENWKRGQKEVCAVTMQAIEKFDRELATRDEEVSRLKSALAAYERPLEAAELANIGKAHVAEDNDEFLADIDLNFGLYVHEHRGFLLSALKQARAEKEALLRAYSRCPKCKPECGHCRCECHGYMQIADKKESDGG